MIPEYNDDSPQLPPPPAGYTVTHDATSSQLPPPPAGYNIDYNFDLKGGPLEPVGYRNGMPIFSVDVYGRPSPPPQEKVYQGTDAEGKPVFASPPGPAVPPMAGELRGVPYMRSRTGQLYRPTPMGTMPVLDWPHEGALEMGEGYAMATGGEQSQIDPTTGHLLREPVTPANVVGGGSKMFRGALQVASPLMIGTGLAAPLPALGMLGAATAASEGTEAVTDWTLQGLGVPPADAKKYASAAGDLAGLFGAKWVHSRMGNLAEIARAPESNAIHAQLEQLIEAFKDPNATDMQKAAIRAQIDGLMQRSRQLDTAGGGFFLPQVSARDILPNFGGFGFKSRLNPVKQAAIGELTEQGVEHLTAGQLTGNRFLRAGEAVTAHTPMGSEAAQEFEETTGQELAAAARRLSRELYPSQTTPYGAGKEVAGRLDKQIADLAEQSNQGYEAAWAHVGEPQFKETVPVRTKPEPILDENGKPTGATKRVPVMKELDMPVDVRWMKDIAKDQIHVYEYLPAAERAQSAAYAVLKKILKGDDFITAQQAEEALKGLKAEAGYDTNKNLRNVAQGVAANLIPRLQEAVDNAVAKTGQDAVEGLRAGRQLHAQKMGIAEKMDLLRKEPVQAFNQLTMAKDAGVDFLRDITKDDEELGPLLGRAYIDQLFDIATREGGWQRARTILNSYQNLGDQTKSILFPNAEMRRTMDRFFLGQGLVSAQINPSGTELTRSAKESLTTNPLKWAIGGIAPKLLYTPRGIQFLVRTMEAPPRSSAAMERIRNEALKIIRDSPEGGTPPEGGAPPGGGTPPQGGGTPPGPRGLAQELGYDHGASENLTPPQARQRFYQVQKDNPDITDNMYGDYLRGVKAGVKSRGETPPEGPSTGGGGGTPPPNPPEGGTGRVVKEAPLSLANPEELAAINREATAAQRPLPAVEFGEGGGGGAAAQQSPLAWMVKQIEGGSDVGPRELRQQFPDLGPESAQKIYDAAMEQQINEEMTRRGGGPSSETLNPKQHFEVQKAASDQLPEQGQEGWRDKLNQASDQAQERIDQYYKDLGTGQFGAGLPPLHLLADYSIVGARKIVDGAKTFGDWSKAMVDTFGKQIQPHLQAIWKEAQPIAEKLGKIRKADRAAGSEQSTRVPTAVKATEDPLSNILTTGYQSWARDPEMLRKNVNAMLEYPNFGDLRDQVRSGALSIPDAAEHIIGRIQENLQWLHDAMPEEFRDRARLWYDGAHKIARKWAGDYGATKEQVAATMAVTSPGTDWFVNAERARRMLEFWQDRDSKVWDRRMAATWRDKLSEALPEDLRDRVYRRIRGKSFSDLSNDPKAAAVWFRLYDEAMNPREYPTLTPEGKAGDLARIGSGEPRQFSWSDFGQIAKGLSILEDGSKENIHEKLGQEHKVRNFYNNIINPDSPREHTTIDTHAVAAGLLRPLSQMSTEVGHNFGGTGSSSSSITGESGTYGLHKEAYRRVAAANGLLPREMQSITWEAIRSMFSPQFKRNPANVEYINSLWRDVSSGKITADAARQRALEYGGGFDRPAWFQGRWNPGIPKGTRGSSKSR